MNGHLQVEQIVATNTEYQFGVLRDIRLVLVLEHDASDVDAGRVDLRAAGDGVVAGLETGDGANNNIERNGPRGDGLLTRLLSGAEFADLITSCDLEDFTESKAG